MKVLKDYSFIRGFCYPGAEGKSEEQSLKELGYAKRLQLNSSRIWLRYPEYAENPAAFTERLVAYVRRAFSNGITTMPILFNGNGLDPGTLEVDFLAEGDAYVRDVVNALKAEPGIIMWDIMNEPSCNDYILKSPEAEKEERYKKVWEFVRHYCRLVKSLDEYNAVTVGHTLAEDVEPTVEAVDVISFHDYSPTERTIRENYEAAKILSQKYGKPFINSELACLCRANPYDLALKTCEEYGTGWYLFELMVGGYWADVHGIFYEDGTVRDPSIVAAVMGFYRNRAKSAVKPNPNKEGHAQKAIGLIRAALEEKTEIFVAERKPVEDILEACEYCANLLESCEMVPMYDPPTARISRLRQQESPDMQEARKLAYELAELLRKNCQIL